MPATTSDITTFMNANKFETRRNAIIKILYVLRECVCIDEESAVPRAKPQTVTKCVGIYYINQAHMCLINID